MDRICQEGDTIYAEQHPPAIRRYLLGKSSMVLFGTFRSVREEASILMECKSLALAPLTDADADADAAED